MPRIDIDAEINSIRLKEQGAAPATPDSGYGQLYIKSDGLYFKGDGGIEVGPHGGWIPVFDTWTYESADDPTYTLVSSGVHTGTYSVGMRIKLTQTTDKFFIVTDVASSGSSTTLTLYGGTDYDLANAAITSPYYSREKAPLGFPLSPALWTVEVIDTTQRTQSNPSAGTWYNLGSISITVPIGCWELGYSVLAQSYNASDFAHYADTTLSTANNSESDTQLTSGFGAAISIVGSSPLRVQMRQSKIIALVSKTTYYLNMREGVADADTLYFLNDGIPCIIRAKCAYL